MTTISPNTDGYLVYNLGDGKFVGWFDMHSTIMRLHGQNKFFMKKCQYQKYQQLKSQKQL